MIIVIFENLYSQGSIATQWRCGGTFSNCFITTFPQKVPVKFFWKLVNKGDDMDKSLRITFLGYTLYYFWFRVNYGLFLTGFASFDHRHCPFLHPHTKFRWNWTISCDQNIPLLFPAELASMWNFKCAKFELFLKQVPSCAPENSGHFRFS